ncbi:UDP-N-acetylmuramoyl-L-alanyl-D-glutamate--2,6-diaminopimelate ligase [Rhizosaccharibacter radicis]|uniref:UDP-N-acetylmuramoyl-L-alanyl-D-glutamate--2,6-diaminopimelate ligase n=1 Tax=Rhizosaccharibacter radicis TaxID=2782605 RepID=A0ABT1VY39_9PROT|nr:UDP-N-acetylmuramoyl-L-alanyl-D-glutamate--2,6-diaminopimelate ligase [Acetobacteraceae bacterium KSS12]
MTRDLLAPLAPAEAGIVVENLSLDSRTVRPGTLFGALPGRAQDGAAFIADAVRRGAAAVLAGHGTAWPENTPRVPLLLSAEPRSLFARLAARHAGPQPSRVVAITGTNGKTSTAEFGRQLAALRHRPAASLGTLGLRSDVALDLDGPALTTPDSVSLARTLAALKRAGIEDVFLEASSHGIEQHRLDGVRISAAGFSNLSRDHLDYHGTLDAYRDAKLRLFSALLPDGAVAVANADMDPDTLSALRTIAHARALRFREVGENGRFVRLLRAVPVAAGQVVTLEAAGQSHELHLRLPGRFQADNALLAAALAAGDDDDIADILPLLASLGGVRGRMELAATLPGHSAAYVDYAHTPDALRRLLQALRPHAAEANGRLVVVFGAGGDRDRGKRPLMGGVAAELADVAVVTDDNPRTEDAAAIRQEVMAGCPGAIEIADRAEAIATALSMLHPGDVLAVAGKGHEQGQIIGTAVLPFDDVATVRRLAGYAP